MDILTEDKSFEVLLNECKIRNDKLNEKELEWAKPFKTIKIINICYVVLIILATVGGFFFGMYETGETQELIIGTLLGLSAGIIFCGVITLLFKPMFWMIRKSMIKKLEPIEAYQYETLQLKLMLITPLNCKKRMRNGWINRENKLYEMDSYKRYLRIEIMRMQGWVWICVAVVFVIGVIIFFTWIIALILLILVVGVMLLLPSSTSNYHRPHYSYEEKHDGIFKSIDDWVFKKYFSLKTELLEVEKEIKNIKADLEQREMEYFKQAE